MTSKTVSYQTFASIEQLRQAARNGESALCRALLRDGSAPIAFKGFRFQCEYVALGRAYAGTHDTVCLTEVDFRHMTFRQVLVHVFARLLPARLVAPLKGRITAASREAKEAIVDGLGRMAHGSAKGAGTKDEMAPSQERETCEYVRRIAELESLHADDVGARDRALVALFKTLLNGDRPLSVAALDEIRRTVWDQEAALTMQALRDDPTFKANFLAASARSSTTRLAMIHERLSGLGLPSDIAMDPTERVREAELTDLLDRIAQLPRELMHDELIAFDTKVLTPLRLQLPRSKDAQQAQALRQCIERVSKRAGAVQALLAANTANFVACRPMPCTASRRRWGRQAVARR